MKYNQPVYTLNSLELVIEGKDSGIADHYIVVGGQYRDCHYGIKPTLHAAKILSTQNAEYWDNWQGWHKPAIYKLSSCYKVVGYLDEVNGKVWYDDPGPWRPYPGAKNYR